MHPQMQPSRHPLRAGIAAGITLVLAAVLWLLFAPQSLGGDFAYALVRGSSMSPALANNDLVLIRSAADYDVGDAVAYRDPQLGTVLHRIVDDDGERFTLQGDNRDAADPYRPTSDEIVGRTWAVIPGAGRLIREIQRPRNAALLVVAAIALIGASATATGRRGRSPPRKPPAISRAGRSLSFYGPAGGNVLAVLVPIMLASVALPVLLYVQGDTRERTETVPFVERGTFSYEAVAGSGVYDGDRLGAPEPLFRRLTDDLPLLYEYEVTPSAPGEELSNVTGSYRLFAEIRQENGWKRTIELQPTMLFAGDRFSTSAVIDLRTVDRLIDGVEEQTGVIADVYRLRVVANVQVEGDLAGRPFTRQLEQALEFRLTDLQLQLMTRSSTIEWTDTGTVTRTVEVGRALSIPLVSLDIPYSTFPILAAVGIGVSALGLLLMALATFLIWRAGEPARIRARYGHRMVAIEVEEGASGEQPLVVDRFDDLVHIADRAGLVILHWEDAMFDDYLVFDQRTSYRYTIWKLPDGWPPELRNVVGPMPGGAQSPFERAA